MAEQINPYQLEVAGPFSGHNKHEYYELRGLNGRAVGTYPTDRAARAELERLQLRHKSKSAVRPKTGNEDLLGGDGADAFLREHRGGRL